MNKDDLFSALSELDPESVEAARHYYKKSKAKPPIWLKWSALAACMVIIFGVLVALPALQYGNPTQFQKGSYTFGGGAGSPTTSETGNNGSGKGGPGKQTTVTTAAPSDTTTTTAGAATTKAGATTTKTGATTTKTGATTTKTGVTTTTRTRATGRTTPDDLPTTTTAAAADIDPTRPTRRTTTTVVPTQPTSTLPTQPTRLPDSSSDVSSCESEAPLVEPETTDDLPANAGGIKKVRATYPKTATEFSWTWWDEYMAPKVQQSQQLQSGIDKYYRSIMKQLLPAKNANTVCSPLNTYISFAMLAETTGGNSRQQILNMLGASDVGTLRKNVSTVWNANYVDLSTFKSLLANSLWLRNSNAYKVDTLNILANKYFASSFVGQMGSSAMNQALKNWTNENTGGLLKQYTNGMSLSPDTVMELVSTVYFQEHWELAFEEQMTKSGTFHGTLGDTTVSMMHKNEVWDVYLTDRYMSLGLDLRYAGTMYFLLPNEGVSVDSLLTDANLLNAVRYNRSDTHWTNADVTLTLPKFNVSSKTDLRSAMRSLGVTDVFDATKADFSPLTDAYRTVFLGKAEHAAMMSIDEEGVAGAAYTEHMGVEPWSDLKIDFTVDRPFLFVLTGEDGSILFAGIVRNIG